MSERVTEVGDMGRFWRLVSVSHGRVSGIVVVFLEPLNARHETRVQPFDLTLYGDEDRRWGRVLGRKDFTAWIRDGVEIPAHMVREEVRPYVEYARADLDAAILLAIDAARSARDEQCGGGSA